MSALRNEDFRKFVTERASTAVLSDATTARATGPSFSHRAKPAETKKKNNAWKYKKPKPVATEATAEEVEDDGDMELREIMKNYRDRAAERRRQGETEDDFERTRAAYRAVPNDARQAAEFAEKRRRAIQESKFLGGDMEHTHLVKGLDYSLLNKVRSEITKTHGDVGDEDLEKALDDRAAAAESAPLAPMKESDSRMVRNINRILFKDELPAKNELFARGRMAYAADMEDDEAEIPTTILRSVFDCPKDRNATVAADSALIQKLTQVLSYLRGDGKKKKKDKEVNAGEQAQLAKHKDDAIFDDAGEYDLKSARGNEEAKSSRREKDDRDARRHDRKEDDREDRRDRDRDRHRDRRDPARERDREKQREREQKEREREEKEKERKADVEKEKKLAERLAKRLKEGQEAGQVYEDYAECYPMGLVEMVGEDSDEEADFSKMDSNKKGLIKRWDFDHEEDFEKYQGSREALPKAAYQFGVKMNDGRKTRKMGAQDAKTVERKLDRELNEINKIIDKRKQGTDAGESSKRPKY
ncbi:unnamed protein product, partial [Mesorhabditis belari]|uniref:Protein Red n=1 Tax=Mesorhabditis belari TaxID=2138241 RepID=A0AAF3E9K0_9BILA